MSSNIYFMFNNATINQKKIHKCILRCYIQIPNEIIQEIILYSHISTIISWFKVNKETNNSYHPFINFWKIIFERDGILNDYL